VARGTMIDKERLYTRAEVAERLRISLRNLAKYVSDGWIKTLTVGGARRISGEELARVLKVGIPTQGTSRLGRPPKKKGGL